MFYREMKKILLRDFLNNILKNRYQRYYKIHIYYEVFLKGNTGTFV